MPSYHKLGQLPPKRHTIFRRPDGALTHEELIGNQGFVGPSSLLYHLHPPTAIRAAGPLVPQPWSRGEEGSLRPRHLRTALLPAQGDPVTGRVPLLFNGDVALSLARPVEGSSRFYRNGQGDELIYVSDGSGVLDSVFGRIPYRRGDYLVIPRGIVHRLIPGPGEQRYLVVESRGVLQTPKRYRNAHGQHLEWSPFTERDFRLPQDLETRDETGEFEILVKQGNGLACLVYAHHPFDVVGWDGYYYPWAFNIEDFEPIVGRVHQPPPVHQVFEAEGFVVCNFVPRPYDFHPSAIPVPYNHTNAQSDEVIYYASDRFMSRKGIEYASITLHPDGIPHGPHPGTVEASLGKKGTDELAVMIDTFRPLNVSREAERIEDRGYAGSWLEEPGSMTTFDPETMKLRDIYHLLTRLVSPRPIAFVSTVSQAGGRNLSPFSYFNLGGAHPPSVVFSVLNDRQGREKDTLLNVRETREFSISVVTREMAAKMNDTSAAYPRETDEFEKAGFTAADSVRIRPPRVAESPASMECRLFAIIPHGEGPLAAHYVIGEVVLVHLEDSVLDDSGLPDPTRIDFLGRMGGDWYIHALASAMFELRRPDEPARG